MRIGEEVSFVPYAFLGEKGREFKSNFKITRRVTGKIVEIHTAHRWCRVKYKIHGYILYECFKISSLEDQ